MVTRRSLSLVSSVLIFQISSALPARNPDSHQTTGLTMSGSFTDRDVFSE